MGSFIRKSIISFIFIAIGYQFVFAQTASFVYSGDNKGCAPLPVTFISTVTTDATTGPIMYREWDYMGTNNFVRVSNDTTFRNYTTDGTYNVTFRVTYTNGSVATKTGVIEVYSIPAVDFSLSDTIGCNPLTVNFSANIGGLVDPVSVWSWDFNTLTNIVNENSATPTVTYAKNGTFEVSLLVTSSKGCTSKEKITKKITIYDPPVPNFTYSGNRCVPGNEITFTNTTNDHGAPVVYEWDFGDGSPHSSDTSPTHAFSTRNSYIVKLTAKIGNSCAKVITKTIQIGSPDITSITSALDTACTGTNVKFSATAIPTSFISSYQWIFGDGSSSTAVSPTKAYSNSGNYTVSLIIKNAEGCADTANRNITILDKPAPFPKITTACDNTIAYTDTVSSYGRPVTYLWTFQTSPLATSTSKSGTYTYATAGTKTVKLTVNNGVCSGEKTLTNVYVGKPVPNFSIVTNLSCSAPVTFTVNATSTGFPSGNTYYWNFGDGGTGTTTSTSTSHTFPLLQVEMTYTVSLVIKSPGGCYSDTIKKTIPRRPMPIVAISADTVRSCNQSLNVHFESHATGLGPLFHAWTFGDGTFSPDSITNHTYINTPPLAQGASRTYIAFVTVRDTAGCSTKSATKNIDFKIPKLTQKVVVSCLIVIMNVDVTNLFPGDKVILHKWDFGDGNTLTSTTASSYAHTYAAAGAYTVKYTATNLFGCEHSITFIVNPIDCIGGGGGTITPPDTSSGSPGAPAFIVSRSCDDHYKFVFSDTSTSANYKIISWNLGDGTVIDAPVGAVPKTITHSYVNPTAKNKTYVIVLLWENTITHDTTYYYKTIKIIDEKAAFTSSAGNKACAGAAITYTPTGITTANIKKYSWIFKVGSSTTTKNPDNATTGLIKYTHSVSGKYTVTLIIEDINGCKDTASMLVSVGSPTVSFTVAPTSGCGDELLTRFTGKAVKYDTVGIKTWRWEFGDASIEPNGKDTISHLYHARAGYYYDSFSPKLLITDSTGCEATYSLANAVKLFIPKADFSTADTLHCEYYRVTFTNNSQPASVSGYPTTYTWDFGFGAPTTTTSRAPFTKVYPNMDATYDVRLIVEVNGCRDTLFRPKYIKFIHPIADFEVSDTLQCAPTPLKFANNSQYAYSYTWDMGDNTTKIITAIKDTLSHNYGIGGFYTIQLNVLGVDGCVDSTTRHTRVRGPSGRLVTFYDKTCLPVLYNMEVVNGLNISKYFWDFQDGTPLSPSDMLSPSVQHWFTYGNFPMSYIPNVILEGPDKTAAGNFCRFQLTSKDTIKLDELHADFDFAPITVCNDTGYVYFTNRTDTTSPTFYKWDFGDGNTSTEINPRHAYDTSGTYTVIMIANAPFSNCTDTVIKTFFLQVHNLPDPSIHGIDSICMMEPFTLTSSVITKGEPVDTYAWYEGNTFLSDSSVLTHRFMTSGTRTIKLITTTTYGCTDSTSKDIKVHPLPTHIVRPDTAICENDNVKLGLQSNGTSFVWTGPNGYTSTVKEPIITTGKPVMTGWYKVTITDDHGCVSYDSVYIKVNPLPTLLVSSNSPVCVNDTIKINTVVSPNVYEWKWTGPNGFTSDTSDIVRPRATVNMAGNYQVIVKDSNLCVSSASVAVVVNILPTLSISSNSPICTGSTITINVNTSGNQYRWTGPNSFISSNKDVSIPNATTAMTGMYRIVVTDANSCRSIDSVDFVVHPLPTNIPSSNSPVCAGDKIMFGLTTNGKTYHWSGPNGYNSGDKDPIIFNATTAMSGLYTVVVTDSNNCVSSASIAVRVNPRPTLIMNYNAPVCVGGTINFSLNTNGSTYQWTGPNGFNSNIKQPIIPNAMPGMAGFYTVTVTDTNLCVSIDSISVIVNPLPSINLSYNNPVCEGSPLQMSLNSSATQYVWTGPGGFSSIAQNPVRNPSTLAMAGKYYVKATDAIGCVSSDSLNVSIDQKVGLIKSPDTYLCISQGIEIWVNGNTTQYSWAPATGLSNPNIRNPIASPTVTTTYTATGHSLNSCPNETANIKVTLTDYPLVSFADSVINALAGESITLNPSASSNSYTFEWTPIAGLSCLNCRRPSFTAERDIVYTVTVTTQYGCKSSASIAVKVSCNVNAMKIPNAFTPNGDGLNDVFRVLGYGIKSIKSMRIYDRYGGLVFSAFNVAPDDPVAAWDGKVHGKEVNLTTGFVYQIELICTDNNIIPFEGELLLIK